MINVQNIKNELKKHSKEELQSFLECCNNTIKKYPAGKKHHLVIALRSHFDIDFYTANYIADAFNCYLLCENTRK